MTTVWSPIWYGTAFAGRAARIDVPSSGRPAVASQAYTSTGSVPSSSSSYDAPSTPVVQVTTFSHCVPVSTLGTRFFDSCSGGAFPFTRTRFSRAAGTISPASSAPRGDERVPCTTSRPSTAFTLWTLNDGGGRLSTGASATNPFRWLGQG